MSFFGDTFFRFLGKFFQKGSKISTKDVVDAVKEEAVSTATNEVDKAANELKKKINKI